MSWLVSLFSPSSRNLNSRKTTGLSRDAFALPTSSPLSSSHPDAFSPDSLNTEPDSAMNASFSYPPPSSGSSYDYVPTSTRSRQSTLLPLHNTPLSPSMSYPPLAHTWERLRTWLSREYPELGDTLNWGILPEDLAQVEMQFGFALPATVRESYLITDGQEPESAAGCSEGLFFGLTLLPLEDVLEEWRFWREVDEDPATGANTRLRDLMQSIPPGWIRKEYSLRGWIPLVSDKGGNYIGIDMNPGEGGAPGQVIVFGRDFDTKVVLWRGDGIGGWAKWLAHFVDEIESGEGYEMGAGEDSEGSEDDLGYESYFYDGSGRGSGDGGGESGTTGIRLSGEYKGWNTLEALADRSLRKWHEAGVLPELPASREKGKQKMTLATFDLSAAGHGSSAEVPIPVMNETGNIAVPLEDAGTEAPLIQSIPTISVTKPPVPMPVDVPTAHDIIPISDAYVREADDDLEAGQGMMMQEIDTKLEHVTIIPRKPLTPTTVEKKVELQEDAILISIPQDAPLAKSPEPISPVVAVDLLSDEEVMLEMPSPTETTPTSSAEVATMPKVEPKSEEAEDSDDEEEDEEDEEEEEEEDGDEDEDEDEENENEEDEDEEEEEEDGEEIEAEDEPEPNATVRLVGGGGVRGVTDGTAEDEESDGDLVEVESMQSASDSSAANATAKHEKTKSSISSGLQKLGKLGGGKRKEGDSSRT